MKEKKRHPDLERCLISMQPLLLVSYESLNVKSLIFKYWYKLTEHDKQREAAAPPLAIRPRPSPLDGWAVP